MTPEVIASTPDKVIGRPRLDTAPPGTELLKMSKFQKRVLRVPEEVDLFLGGGRGGAKSYTMLLLALRHVEQYGPKAHILYIRQTHVSCADFEALCIETFSLLYGRNVKYNSTKGLFKFPNGATLEINQLETIADYTKFQGRSFTLLMIDEAGNYAMPDMLDKLRSNLRGPAEIPTRIVLAANPGDAGHHWLASRYVFRAAPWTIFKEPNSQRMFLYAPSTFLDNPFINQAEYKAQLVSSCPSDPELLRAWLEGDWAIARGAFFGGCLEESRNAVAFWNYIIPPGWDWWLAHDWGCDRPSVTYIVAKSPGGVGPDGQWYPRDSLVLVDEFASNEPGHMNKGMGWLVPKLAEEIIRTLCVPWNVAATGVADDQCFAKGGHSRGSVAEEFVRCGIIFVPAKKGDRISGWTTMKRLLGDAGKMDMPGLYISRACHYFWATVPYLARDPRKAEDMDSKGPDHGADAARYGVLREERSATMKPMF
jgi:hypothetical protein